MTAIFINPDEKRLRSGWRLALQLVILLGVALALLIPALMLLAVAFVALGEPVPGLQPGALPGAAGMSWVVLAIGGAIEFVAVTISVFLARRLADRRTIASLGLWWNSRARRDLLAGFLIAGLMIALMFLIQVLGGWLVVEDLAFSHVSPGEMALQLLALFTGFVVVGWSEELLFRGYWLQNLTEGLNLGVGVLISSMLFSLAHLGNPGVSSGALVGLFLAGLFFAYSLLRSGNLWLPLGLHIGWNFFEGPVFGFEVSGLEAFRLVEHSVRGPEILLGGEFGPEAGLVLLPALGLGVLLIHLLTRSRAAGTIPLGEPGLPAPTSVEP